MTQRKAHGQGLLLSLFSPPFNLPSVGQVQGTRRAEGMLDSWGHGGYALNFWTTKKMHLLLYIKSSLSKLVHKAKTFTKCVYTDFLSFFIVQPLFRKGFNLIFQGRCDWYVPKQLLDLFGTEYNGMQKDDSSNKLHQHHRDWETAINCKKIHDKRFGNAFPHLKVESLGSLSLK